MARLTLTAVAKDYGTVNAVRAVDLDVADGEFVVLVGPSGCGKSTLLRVVAGLEEASSGQILLDGRDVTHTAPRDRGMAMVFQDYALYPQMTVAENLGFALRMQGRPAADIRQRVARVAGMLELEPYLARKPKALSGGQRQRVALGRALVREPSVFLFDEPLSNLDAKLRVSMRMEIRKLQLASGTTSLYVTHDQVEAMTMADRIVVMRGGVVQQVGSPMEIYRNPVNAFVGSFIGAPPMSIARANVQGGRLVFGPGAELALPPDRAAVLARAGLAQVDVGMRSEHVTVTGADTPDTIPVPVVLVEDHGADSIAVVSLAGQDVLARARPGAEAVGTQGRAVRIDTGAVHFFHPEGGQRLA